MTTALQASLVSVLGGAARPSGVVVLSTGSALSSRRRLQDTSSSSSLGISTMDLLSSAQRVVAQALLSLPPASLGAVNTSLSSAVTSGTLATTLRAKGE